MQNTHGIQQRTAYTGYGDNRKDRSSIVLRPPVEIKYMNRRRNNSVAVNRTVEVKNIDENTILLKVKSELFNMITGPDSSRWNYQDADARHSVTEGTSFKIEEQIYLISADVDMNIGIPKDEDYLVVGSKGDSTTKTSGDRTTYTDASGNNLTCVALKGSNAKIWDKPSDNKVAHILNPSSTNFGIVEYTSPKFKALPRKELMEEAQIGKPLKIQQLLLHKARDESKVTTTTGKLTSALDIDDLIITCNLCRGTVLTYLDKKGRTVSRDIEEGIYNIVLKNMDGSKLSEYRKAVINAADEISVDFEVNRLDFLTSLEIEDDEIRTDSTLTSRVDAGASISIEQDNKNVDTDKLVNRISIINIDDED